MNLLSITDLSKHRVQQLIKDAALIKAHPKRYYKRLQHKTLLMFFEMPSLRTEISFDVAMHELGGDTIDYHAQTSPWRHGKESIEDVAHVLSRYVDCVMMRVHDDKALRSFANHSDIPVLNGLTSLEHPCQILSDLFTIKEHFGKLKGLTLAYVGDSNNNVTHSLLLGCAIIGMHMRIGCPKKKTYMAKDEIIRKARALMRKHGGSVSVINDATKAVEGADIVYTDSWMSYRINKTEKAKRMKDLTPYKVTQALMKHAKPSAVFMHCLPASRQMEVTKSVIDGKQSIVFDQAENRLHTEKALLLHLMR